MNEMLADIDDQTFWVKLGLDVFTTRIYEFRGAMYADVQTGDSYVLRGKRILPGKWILPKWYSSKVGNMRFEARAPDASTYPNYKEFNRKFVFAYYTMQEISEME